MPRSASSSRIAETDRELAAKLRGIGGQAGGALGSGHDRAQIREVVDEVMRSLGGSFSPPGIELYHELESLADEIQVARREFVAMRPGEIRGEQIQEAGHELDAVVDATSKATWEILAAMEELDKMAPGMEPGQRDAVQGAVMRVYEACNFQDITGQRVTKVVKTLKHVEEKMEALLAVFSHLPHLDEEIAERQGEAALLNGPALPQNSTNSQADIDALLASFD